MFISAGLFTLLLGILCFRNHELAWYLYEVDNRMWGIHVERPQNWRDLVFYASTTLIFIGAAAVIIGFKMVL